MQPLTRLINISSLNVKRTQVNTLLSYFFSLGQNKPIANGSIMHGVFVEGRFNVKRAKMVRNI